MNETIKNKIQNLYKIYSKNLPNKLLQLKITWINLQNDFTQQKYADFHRQIHSLCGSAGTYGFTELSKNARELEKKLLRHMDVTMLNKSLQLELQTLMDMLTETKFKQGSLPYNLIEKQSNVKLILLIDHDDELLLSLQNSISRATYDIQSIQDLAVFDTIFLKETPAAVIIHSRYFDSPQIETVLNRRKQQDFPMICIAEDNQLISRLKALRSGANHFLVKPINTAYLAKLIERVCGYSRNESYRVLIVEDTELLAKYYEIILREAGMEALAITDPVNIFTHLNDFQPNLLLLDLYMPLCSGYEIAKILRQEERYASLPIIFLSIEYDKYKQLASLSSGADDFLTKPVAPQHLISTIVSRVKRSSILSSYIKRDSLTLLLNHTYILEQFELELSKAARSHFKVVFAMIDIDHFKKINDRFGHLAGDYVLEQISQLLTLRTRKQDYVGRYGGEEFAIIMPNTEVSEAVDLCNQIREELAKIQFSFHGDDFAVTLSAGICYYPYQEKIAEIIASADEALYKAKARGRNRIEVICNQPTFLPTENF